MNFFEFRVKPVTSVSILCPGKPTEEFVLLLVVLEELITARTFE